MPSTAPVSAVAPVDSAARGASSSSASPQPARPVPASTAATTTAANLELRRRSGFPLPRIVFIVLCSAPRRGRTSVVRPLL
ncbi:hypothetical protein [Umezawaea sp. Da 62-37]|uniref:hypothetical protein n=1 Tax=Umezawaea sp. Da 62-37 TaxID=3075927 RepID=UPI0028F71920|nr:hypothetical protein [Umezawaea sp. Da 62-37]WNV85655.1 hypothetical protein RM788_47315 [Umezawaea sp. Da 62-37]